jgi:MFS family permease
MVAVGVLFGSLEVAMVAFADAQGDRAAAGVLLPLVALASGVAGLAYGARAWRAPLDRRFLLALAGLTVGTVPLLVAPGVVAMAVAALAAGVAISPSLIASFGLAERLVPAASHTEGFTWLNTGLNVGVAIGASTAGALADGPGARWAFGVCTAGSVLALTVAVAGRRSLLPERVALATPA